MYLTLKLENENGYQIQPHPPAVMGDNYAVPLECQQTLWFAVKTVDTLQCASINVLNWMLLYQLSFV